MTQPPVSHGDFTIERIYDASPARVFAAFSDLEVKARWFVGPPGWTLITRQQVFEPGGHEILSGRFPSGLETLYTARFHAIDRDERIVSVYDMHLNGRHHSVSLATVQIAPVTTGTRLVYTEQIAYLDGTNGAEGTAMRERGVGDHLDRLETALRDPS
jgi:uncharacterized protein YndB with AHSA1/START domain